MTLRASALRVRVLGLVVLAVVPGIALTGWAAWDDGQARAAEIQQGLQAAARMAAGEHTALLASTRRLVAALPRWPDVRAEKPAACSAVLERILPLNPQIAAIGLAAPDGAIRCSAAAGTGHRGSVA